MGHGDHWQAVESNEEEFIISIVKLICKEGVLVGAHSLCPNVEGLDQKERIVSGFQYPYPESPISFLALGVRDDGEGNQVLRTVYPVCAEGPCTRLVVDAVEPLPNNMEGTVTASMPEGDSFCFFDPFFFLNSEKYQEWAEIDVALTALAYLLEKAELEPEELPSESPRQQTTESFSAEDYAMAPDTEDMPMVYEPCGEFGDSAEIGCVVEEAVPVACIGRLYWRMTGVIMRADNGEEMSIHIYASERVLKGYVPQPGDFVRAIAWLQGRLLGVV
jgi:hypothetical protein